MTNKDFLKKLGMELKVARIRKELKQDDLVKLTGLTDKSISNIEAGRTDSKILSYKRIADALGVELKEMF